MRMDREKVRTLMREQDIRWLHELAAALDVAPQTVSAWWTGTMPEWSTLEALCVVLDCKLDDIIKQPAKTGVAAK